MVSFRIDLKGRLHRVFAFAFAFALTLEAMLVWVACSTMSMFTLSILH